jgi:hypothetical protein
MPRPRPDREDAGNQEGEADLAGQRQKRHRVVQQPEQRPGQQHDADAGGTTPLVAIYAVTHTDDDLSPAFYLMAAGAASLLVTLTVRETYRSPLR